MEPVNDQVFKSPVFLALAVMLFAVAIIEKLLNLLGTSIPIIDVYPSQLLGWATFLLILDIALLVRQILENKT